MINLIDSINFFNKKKLPVKSVVRSITALYTLSMLSGCAAVMEDAIIESVQTDKTYNEMASTLPPLTDGRGRLYLYRTGASTEYSFQYGAGFKKNITYCTVDDAAYELIWEAFRYIDLPKGDHEVTCGNDVLKKVGYWSNKGHFQRGENKIQVSVSSGSEIFIRVDTIKEKPFFQPILVKPEQGREEMVELPYQKSAFVGNGDGGKISN